MRGDVVVLVGGCAAVTAGVIVSDAPDDQVATRQQRVLLVPTEKERQFVLSSLVPTQRNH